MERADTVILGAGAAGMFCAGSIAALAPGRGGRVVVIDHAAAPGEKIRISGGGRCNFTNLATSHERFLSGTARFCASALAGFGPRDFVDLVDRAGIAWHEKTQGQLFCDGSAREIVEMLRVRMGRSELWLGTPVGDVAHSPAGWRVVTGRGEVVTRNLVVATGGRSIPRMGATGLGHDIARSLGLSVVEPRPGLVPLTFAAQDLDLFRTLAGLSLEAGVSHGEGRARAAFRDGLLFTHRGLSGPAILQISSFWRPGEAIIVDLAPEVAIGAALREARGRAGRVGVARALAEHLPARLADAIAAEAGLAEARLADQPNTRLDALGARVNRWRLMPVGSEGWRTAEVTVGGVDCRALDARSLEVRGRRGLFFVGEVVDVTGWLGGYNFQWAWASGHAAARAIVAAG